MWLLINNIHEEISRWLSRRNPRVSHNEGKIRPSRVCAWFESKRFDWLSLSFFDHWPIRMLGFICFLILYWINSFLHCFKKNCTALNQSEWRNFFMYIINWKIIPIIKFLTRDFFNDIISVISLQNLYFILFYLFVYVIKWTLHGSLKILILFPCTKNNILLACCACS